MRFFVPGLLTIFFTTLAYSDAPIFQAQDRLNTAIRNPEYLLNHWVELPTAPHSNTNKPFHLSLREALLLALRYNPNIQNAELDRIVQRYQLRLAHNEFELQYALAGTAQIEQNTFSKVGNATTKSYLATPEFDLKNRLGGELALTMDNNVAGVGGYNQLMNLSYRQPLLRGFGKGVNEAGLLNAEDADWLNQLNLKQEVIDQITQVITAYRSLILSANNYENQRRQLQDAKKSYQVNEKRINAGHLEPAGNIQQGYQIESISLRVEQAENEFIIASQSLLQAIGLDPEMKIAVPNDVELNEIKLPNIEQSINMALKQNTQYLALELAVRVDERAYQVAKNQQLWQLDLVANAQTGTLADVESTRVRGIQGIYNGQNTSKSAGIVLRVPLHDLQRRNELISAKIRLEKDRINLIAGRRALMTSIKNTIASISSQAKQYELAKRQLTFAAKAYELEKKKQNAGISTALDVNNTQNQLIQAQESLIQAKISYLNQVSALQRIIGTTLNEWQIQLKVGPNANFK